MVIDYLRDFSKALQLIEASIFFLRKGKKKIIREGTKNILL